MKVKRVHSESSGVMSLGGMGEEETRKSLSLAILSPFPSLLSECGYTPTQFLLP